MTSNKNKRVTTPSVEKSSRKNIMFIEHLLNGEHVVPSKYIYSIDKTDDLVRIMPSDNILAKLDCSVLPSAEENVNDSSTGHGKDSTTYTQASTSATGSEILNDLSKVNEPVVETIDEQKQVECTLIDMLPYVIKELEKQT